MRRPSRTPAPTIAVTAHSIEPSIASRMAVMPRQSATNVTILGRSSRSGTGRKPRLRDDAAEPEIGSGGGALASFKRQLR